MFVDNAHTSIKYRPDPRNDIIGRLSKIIPEVASSREIFFFFFLCAFVLSRQFVKISGTSLVYYLPKISHLLYSNYNISLLSSQGAKKKKKKNHCNIEKC